MKIVKRIRDIHQGCAPRYEKLKSEVQGVLKSRVEDVGWFYFSRIKSVESFAQKIETGRVADPAHMEDFFACTIVVSTITEIGKAEELVFRRYDRKERRPAEDHFTKKASSSFLFDDLRLYAAMRPQISGKHQDLDGIIFEVQIKTILQHAWSVVTHDMIYKTDAVSWPLERIAYQVKAMLEHAEISVSEAVVLARSRGVAREDQRTRDVVGVIGDLRRLWLEEQLPMDVKRLATNILELLRGCGVSVARFSDIVAVEVGRVGGVSKDLSPYAFTVQALSHSVLADLRRALERPEWGPVVVIHSGMDVPQWMRVRHPMILDLSSAVDPV